MRQNLKKNLSDIYMKNGLEGGKARSWKTS